VRLWDLPLRLFHWSLVVAVGTAIATGLLGGNLMPLHGQAGLAILGLLVFRVVWGFIGPHHARFATFAPTPARLKAYLQGRWQGLGHNPLGALSVFALLGLLAAQAGTGLFANDDIAFTGPLYAWIDEDFALRLTGIHHQLAQGLFVLVGLHVAAIVFYLRVKKNNLVNPMIRGWKEVQTDHPASHAPARSGSGWLAFAISLLLSIGSVTAIAKAEAPAAPLPTAAASKSAPTPAW
jgi:cytochrome b